MASSVSSKRAFSSAGITICKRRNRLDEDIVEALVLCLARPQAVSRAKPGQIRPGQAEPLSRLGQGFGPA
jgi:hypothetical protein